MPSRDELKMLRALPLDIKVRKTKQRIKEWVDYFGEDGVYISFSGGKDSTVLLFIARQMYPKIPAVFANTGLEYPDIKNFVHLHMNTTIIRPSMNFKKVVTEYGYPVIGKEVAEYIYTVRHSKGKKYVANRLARLNGTFRRKDGKLSQYNRPQYKYLLNAPFEISSICCTKMKKDPFHEYSKKTGRVAIMATMTEESKLREGKWLKNGCNSFEGKNPNSAPLAFWTEQDILKFLYVNHDEILKTIIDPFLDSGLTNNEIEEMNIMHPWAQCYGNIVPYTSKEDIDGQMILPEIAKRGDCRFRTTKCKRTGCIFCLFGISQDPERMIGVQHQEPKIADFVLRGGEVNEKGMWQPSRDGMGMWFVIDWLSTYGKIMIPYENQREYHKRYGNEFTKKCLEVKNAAAENK